MDVKEVLEDVGVELLWFDSLGAKSSCISACWGKVVIDPGAAEMQPSYPLSSDRKRELRKEAIRRIETACRLAEVIIVTHYHYDHHVLPSDADVEDPLSMYLRKKIIALKDPNTYINESQWHRARKFLSELLALEGKSLESYLVDPQQKDFVDPVEELEIALSKDFGSYQKRRLELLEKGKAWFAKLKELWSSSLWVSMPIELDSGAKLVRGEGTVIELGECLVKILGPWFHGIEYDRTGWVTPIIIETPRGKVFYTSDLMGPAIEDYAYHIAREKPRIVVADGPPTYLFPYMLNRINLERAVDNATYIIENAAPEVFIYDHHLLREKRWRQRIARVFEVAKRVGTTVLTAAECLGLNPLIDTL